MSARDNRLPTKASIYAFRVDGRAYAVPFEVFEVGRAFGAGARQVFLFRPTDVAIFYSTSEKNSSKV